MKKLAVLLSACLILLCCPTEVRGAGQFADVPESAYYYEAVRWAGANAITGGTGAGLFSPNAPCTRAQAVVLLWRAAGSPKGHGGSAFGDVRPDAYYSDAVAWAVERGITRGTSQTAFSPEAPCTRGQIVTLLYRFAEGAAAPEDVPGEPADAFGDVTAESYCYAPVYWAAYYGIARGTGARTFSPGESCTRAQIVTFLWRYAGGGEPWIAASYLGSRTADRSPETTLTVHSIGCESVVFSLEYAGGGIERVSARPVDDCTAVFSAGDTAGTLTFREDTVTVEITEAGKDFMTPETLRFRARTEEFPYRDCIDTGSYAAIVASARRIAGSGPENSAWEDKLADARGTLADLNGDGTEELILTYFAPAGYQDWLDSCDAVFSVYTLADGRPVPLLEKAVRCQVDFERAGMKLMAVVERDGETCLLTAEPCTRYQLYRVGEDGLGLCSVLDVGEFSGLVFRNGAPVPGSAVGDWFRVLKLRTSAGTPKDSLLAVEFAGGERPFGPDAGWEFTPTGYDLDTLAALVG